jgi:hypothetical protein
LQCMLVYENSLLTCSLFSSVTVKTSMLFHAAIYCCWKYSQKKFFFVKFDTEGIYTLKRQTDEMSFSFFYIIGLAQVAYNCCNLFDFRLEFVYQLPTGKLPTLC